MSYEKNGIKQILESVEGLPEDTAITLEESFNQKVENVAQERATELAESEREEIRTEVKLEMAEKIDQFMDSITSEWLTENAIALDQSIKAGICENLIEGIVGVMAENNIKAPETDDVIDIMESKVQAERKRANKLARDFMEADKKLKTLTFENVVRDVADANGLSLMQASKLRNQLKNESSLEESKLVAKAESVAKGLVFESKTRKPKGRKFTEAKKGKAPHGGMESDHSDEDADGEKDKEYNESNSLDDYMRSMLNS